MDIVGHLCLRLLDVFKGKYDFLEELNFRRSIQSSGGFWRRRFCVCNIGKSRSSAVARKEEVGEGRNGKEQHGSTNRHRMTPDSG